MIVLPLNSMTTAERPTSCPAPSGVYKALQYTHFDIVVARTIFSSSLLSAAATEDESTATLIFLFVCRPAKSR